MQKLFVLNVSPQQIQQLRERLGPDYEIVVCHSTLEVQQQLERVPHAVVMSASAATYTNGSSASRENSPTMSEVPGDVERLVHSIVTGRQSDHPLPSSLAARVDLLEQKIIESTLSRNRHHRKDTAAELGISRVTLYNKMKKFGMLN